MKRLTSSLLAIFLFTINFALPIFDARAGTVIDVPGVHIQTGLGGTSVIAPGVDIQTPTNPADTGRTAILVPSEASGSVIVDTVQTMVRPQGASYANAQLDGVDFNHQNLAGADFSNASLTRINFQGANLSGANLSNTNLDGADLSGAILVGANLSNASLARSNLSGANLSGANLTNVTIDRTLAIGTRFDGATLINVDMNQFVRQHTQARPDFVDARAIKQALLQAPSRSGAIRKIDLTVNFDFNSDKLTQDGMKQVYEIAKALEDAEAHGLSLVVEGHTDGIGSDDYNQRLSQRRAARVQQTLVNVYNVPEAALKAKGMGKTQPIASNETDIGRAMNRRVTLVNTGR